MRKLTGALLLIAIVLPVAAAAEPVFPTSSYGPMHEQLGRQDRLFYRFLALPFGWALEAYMKTADDADVISAFLDQSASEDVEAVTGRSPYDLFTNYEEHGDLGMFGGVAAVGTAFRYMTLKRDGAPADVLAAARHDLVRAIENQHVFWAVTGEPGVVARGIRRLKDEVTGIAIPDHDVPLVPLKDTDGNPLPAPKDNGTWRADNSGGALPADTWVWIDSCSKDQLVGQIFAMVALYDAALDDPDIDQALIAQMRADAQATARMLMVKRDISVMEGPSGTGEYDLIIMDSDGRPTMFHDLSPWSMEKFYMPENSGVYNIFNLTLALGIMKGLFHVTGDGTIETYIYEELMGSRGYLEMMDRPLDDEGVLDYIYANQKTNFSNVNMIATGIWLALYTESDQAVSARLQNFMERRWWNREGQSRTAALSKQPFYSAVWMSVTDRGVERSLADETARLLAAFDLGPYLNPYRENCDAAEIEARNCLAIDGVTTLDVEQSTNRSGDSVSDVALDPSIRPPSNFDARSDPFEMNGGGGLRLNPGGDLLAAYWMGRYFPLNPVGTRGMSPNAREHIEVPGLDPIPEPVPEFVEAGADVLEPTDTNAPADAAGDLSTNDGGKGGSGCSSSGRDATPLSTLLLLIGAAILLRRRQAA